MNSCHSFPFRIFMLMQVQRPSALWWSLSKRVTAQFYQRIGMKSAKRKLKWSLQILWNLENGKDSCNIISFTLILYSLFLLRCCHLYFSRMGIVTELLDFNKVRRFQEFCGIVATTDDDPNGIDAVMRWWYITSDGTRFFYLVWHQRRALYPKTILPPVIIPFKHQFI